MGGRDRGGRGREGQGRLPTKVLGGGSPLRTLEDAWAETPGTKALLKLCVGAEETAWLQIQASGNRGDIDEKRGSSGLAFHSFEPWLGPSPLPGMPSLCLSYRPGASSHDPGNAPGPPLPSPLTAKPLQPLGSQPLWTSLWVILTLPESGLPRWH